MADLGFGKEIHVGAVPFNLRVDVLFTTDNSGSMSVPELFI